MCIKFGLKSLLYPYNALPSCNFCAVATIRERGPGVFEIRVFVGRDDDGRPVQTSRTVRGSRRKAEKVAASLTVKAPAKAAGRTVEDALEAWLEVSLPTWAPSSAENQLSRARLIASARSRGCRSLACPSMTSTSGMHE